MQRAEDTARGLPPIYTPTRNTYVKRRVTKSISKSSVWQPYLEFYLISNQQTRQYG